MNDSSSSRLPVHPRSGDADAHAFARSPRGSQRARLERETGESPTGLPADLPERVRIGRARPEGDLGDLEGGFLARSHDRDRRLIEATFAVVGAVAVLMLGLLAATVGIVSDIAAALTALVALVSGLGVMVVSDPHSRATFTGTAVVWYVLVCAALTGIMLVGPPRIVHTEIVFFLITTLVLLPIGILALALPAAGLTFAAAWNARLAVAGQPELFPLMVGEIVVLLATLSLGLWHAIHSRHHARESFLAEARLAESRREAAELARLIPVCSYCRQVRSDDAFWEAEGPALERRRILASTPALCAPCAQEAPKSGGEAARAPQTAPGVVDSAGVGDGAFEPAEAPVRSGLFAHLLRRLEPDLGPLEERFREHFRETDRSAFTVFAVVVMLFLFANMVRGFAVELGEHAVGAQAVRASLLLFTGATLFAVRRIDAHGLRDRVLCGWALGIAVAAAGFMLLGARGAPATTPLLLIMAVYLIVPVPLWMRAFASFTCSVLALAFVDAAPTGGYATNLFVALVVVHAVGLVAARTELAAARAGFVAGVRELEEIERMEQLAELMPMCTCCGRIRDDDGYWTNVFEYLRTHTDYRASHGICPDCLAEHHPDIVGSCEEAGGHEAPSAAATEERGGRRRAR